MQEFATLVSMIAGYRAATNGLKLLTARRSPQPERTVLLHRHATRALLWLAAWTLSILTLLGVPLYPGGSSVGSLLDPILPTEFNTVVLMAAATVLGIFAYFIATGFLTLAVVVASRILPNLPRPASRLGPEITDALLAAGRLIFVLAVSLFVVPSYATAGLLGLFSESWPLYEAIPLVLITASMMPVLDLVLLMIHPRLATPFIRKLAEPLQVLAHPLFSYRGDRP